MNQRMHIVTFDHTQRPAMLVGRFMRHFPFLFGRQAVVLPVLIVRVEEATSPAQLAKTLNRLQDKLWQLPVQERSRFREIIISALTNHVLHADNQLVRRESASWLRLFVQSGHAANPTAIFVTLITAAVQYVHTSRQTAAGEQNPYLKMIFDCFGSFRHLSQAYTWEVFPPNNVFYPLAELFQQAGEEDKDMLLAIFAELPTLSDPPLRDSLLPTALRWAQSEDMEQRRRIAGVLARMHCAAAQQSLAKLLQDADLRVRIAARDAAHFGEAANS